MFFNPDWPDWLFVIGLVVTLPFIIAWPFWLLARFAGAPWTLVVRRKGKEVRRETVRGWADSRQRMRDIIAEARSQGGPEAESGATIY